MESNKCEKQMKTGISRQLCVHFHFNALSVHTAAVSQNNQKNFKDYEIKQNPSCLVTYITL